MLALIERILLALSLALISQTVSMTATTSTLSLLNLGRLNLTNCSGNSGQLEDTQAIESGLRTTVCNVFNSIDEIFKRVLDFPMFYPVQKHINDDFKMFEDESSGKNIEVTSKTGIESADSVVNVFVGNKSALRSEEESLFKDGVSKNEKAPGLILDSVFKARRRVGPDSTPSSRSKRQMHHGVTTIGNEYPYVVSIHNTADPSFLQTGVLLNNRLVVTVASGLFDVKGKKYEPNELFVTRTPMLGEKKCPVLKIFQDPMFKMMSNGIALNDLALLAIVGQDTDNITYPSLPKHSAWTVPQNCSVFSWSKPNEYFRDSEISHLRKVDIDLSDPSSCQKQNAQFNETNHFCSVFREARNSYAGAPLICSRELYGFLSSEGPIADSSKSNIAIYNRISFFTDFIEKTENITLPQNFAQDWIIRELDDVASKSDSSMRPDMNQLIASPLLLLITFSINRLL